MPDPAPAPVSPVWKLLHEECRNSLRLTPYPASWRATSQHTKKGERLNFDCLALLLYLLAQPQTLDQLLVTLGILAFQIRQMSAALTNQLQQSPARSLIMLVLVEMVEPLSDQLFSTTLRLLVRAIEPNHRCTGRMLQRVTPQQYTISQTLRQILLWSLEVKRRSFSKTSSALPENHRKGPPNR